MKIQKIKTNNSRGITLIALVITIALNSYRCGRKLKYIA